MSPIVTRDLYLDFVRGIAILLALGWHFNTNTTGFWPIDILLISGRTIGWAGVDLFFVLSGFLIGGLIFKEYKKTGTFRSGRFLIRRAFKIWPILYAYLSLLLVSGRYEWDTFLFQNLFHIQNYFLTPLAHLWSLAVEEQFYVLFAFGFMAFNRSKANVKTFVYIIGSFLIFCLVFRVFANANLMSNHQIQVQTQYRIDALSFGICLSYFNLYHRVKFDNLASKKILLAMIFFISGALLIFTQGHPALKVTIGYTASYISGGALLLFCYQNKVISNNNIIVKGIAWLGVYSYAMYVFQFVMMRIIEALLKKYHVNDVPPALDLLIKYGGAIFIAVVMTKLIERPMLDLREKYFPSYLARTES